MQNAEGSDSSAAGRRGAGEGEEEENQPEQHCGNQGKGGFREGGDGQQILCCPAAGQGEDGAGNLAGDRAGVALMQEWAQESRCGELSTEYR